MGMGVDEARGDGAAGEVDDLGCRSGQGRGAGVGAQIDDAALAHRQAALDGAGRGHRVEAAVAQDQVGGVLGEGRNRGGEEDCQGQS